MIVGQYTDRFNKLTGQSLPCGDIVQSPGLAVHIKNHHPDKLHRINDIPAVISDPDYIGHNPKEPDSVEMVKRMGENVMVCIKLDRKDNYLFVATVFEITEGKLQNRLKSGRIKSC